MTKPLIAATRGGDLAIAQTAIVIAALKKKHPDIEIKIKKIATEGDRDRRTALWELKDSGFFTSQLEQALLAGKADFAVHSLKDLPVYQQKELAIAAVCERHFTEDCMLAADSINSIEQLPKSAKVGSSSLRRAVQIKQLRQDVEIVPVRGNVRTRLKLVAEGKLDAIILARAGLERIGLANKISFCFDPKQFIPSPAQGALAVQTRGDDTAVNSLAAGIDDPQMRTAAMAERQVLASMHCGCHAPAGAFAEIAGNDIVITAFISDMEGSNFIKRQICGSASEAKKLAEQIAKELLDAGGKEILEKLES